jgi:hypothetical protein
MIKDGKLEVGSFTQRVEEIARDCILLSRAGYNTGIPTALNMESIADAVMATIGTSHPWSLSRLELLEHARNICKEQVRYNKHARMQKWLGNNAVAGNEAAYELMLQNAALVEMLNLYLSLLTIDNAGDRPMRLGWVTAWFESGQWEQFYRGSISKLRSVKGLRELGGHRTRENAGSMTLHAYRGGFYEIVAKSDESGYVCREYAREYELEDKLRHMTSVLVGKIEPIANGGF